MNIKCDLVMYIALSFSIAADFYQLSTAMAKKVIFLPVVSIKIMVFYHCLLATVLNDLLTDGDMVIAAAAAPKSLTDELLLLATDVAPPALTGSFFFFGYPGFSSRWLQTA